MTVLITSMAVALLLSAACSLLEAVLLSLTPLHIAALAERYPVAARAWQRHKTEIQRPIAVILIINTLAHTVGATVAGAQFESLFGAQWLAVFSLVFSFLILQFTEILPKTLGVRYNTSLAPFIAVPLATTVRLMSPVLFVIRWMNRPFEGRRGADHPQSGALEDIATMAGMARISNLIGPHEDNIIKSAAHISVTSAEEVMLPVDQITFLSTNQTMTDAVLTAHFDPHTRFPIIEGDDKNAVLGYVNFKEMIYRARTNPGDPSLRGIIRPVHYVAPESPAAELLKAFVEEHVHMAIVRSDDGRTLGLVTMEDLVEELVGELEDEFDRLPRMLHALSGGTWMVGGGFPIAQLADALGVTLPEAQGSTSAWLIARMGRLPALNEVHKEGELEFLIRRTRRGKIFEVAVTPSGKAAVAESFY
ncbi:MAG: HlyC/CorC family transporter [Candidatus Hydrogenedentes bacterium]|nr:HlyC/CorC family transporter [Candidatus Hydrogenedentota bacterium]